MEHIGRVPPQAVEVEEMILGAMLLEQESLEIATDLLKPDDFYRPANKHIFEAFQFLYREDGVADMITIENYLRDNSLLDVVGGSGYLADLTRSMSNASNIEYHCQIIIDKSIKRKSILSCNEIIKMAYDNSIDSNEVMDEWSRKVSDVDKGSKGRQSLTPSEIEQRDINKPIAEKLYLGISDLDYGIYSDANRRGEVEVTIADSGHGKTQYALFKAKRLENKNNIAWFQLEDYDSKTAKYFETDNVYICHSLYDIEDIKREARILNRDVGIDYIVFDYVQNIECNQKISKTERVEYISQQITRLAKDLNCVCHVLSQVSINYTARSGWKLEPSYGDVRWSQQLKQDAHIITSVFRPSKIESLVINEKLAKDWNDNSVPFNSVFVKQVKVRHGVQEWKRLHMIHLEDGLKPYAKSEAELLYG